MTENEIEMAMESLFFGAERVRANKHANRVSKNLHRQFTARIITELWDEKKKNCKAA
tara:strand:- start:94 stop:264 length:171 start_codon:yes stop_codon:yes gene_type:complete